MPYDNQLKSYQSRKKYKFLSQKRLTVAVLLPLLPIIIALVAMQGILGAEGMTASHYRRIMGAIVHNRNCLLVDSDRNLFGFAQ